MTAYQRFVAASGLTNLADGVGGVLPKASLTVARTKGFEWGGQAGYIQRVQGRKGHRMTVTERSSMWLERGGLRPTRQRMVLAGLLVGDGENRHVTAESLHGAVGQSDEKVSLATVYNTLRAFCDAGLMQEVVVDGTKSYFDTRMDDHPHFFWEDTHELTDAPADELVLARVPDAPVGMVISRVDVVIRLKRG